MSMNVAAAFRQRTWGWWLAALWSMLVGVAFVVGSFWELDLGQNLRARLQSPSLTHPFGTTNRGVDVFKLMIEGTPVTILIALSATLMALVVGGAFGLMLGYWRGRVDQAGIVLLDAFSAFPALVAVIAAVLFFGNSVRNVTLVIGLLTVPIFTRIMRSVTLQYVDRDFVRAARMLGARHRRVLTRELLPNVAVPVLGYALIVVGIVIAIEGALSLFGAGVPEETNTWGKVIAGGNQVFERSAHMALLSAGTVFATVLALNKIAEDWTARWGSFGMAVRAGAVATPDVEPLANTGPNVAAVAPLLVIDNVHTWLPTAFGVVRAVDGVSLSVDHGEFVALVGESGSGKTMLARSVLGLAPTNRLTKVPGSIRYRDTELFGADESVIQQHRGFHIAMVFQDPMTQLNPVMRVGAQIAEPIRVHLNLSRSAADARAVDLLAEVGVPDPRRRARQYAHELSGGLRQRVAIAIALAADPSVLVMDEPTSALDVTVQAELLDLVDRLRQDRGLGVLFITHDLGVVASRADRVAVMYAGRIVEEGSTVEVFAAPRHPYTRALIDAVPAITGPGHQRLAAIGGIPPVVVGPRLGCSFAPRCPSGDGACLAAVPLLTAASPGTQRRHACVHPLVLT